MERVAGIQTGGPAGLHARDRQAFANALDRWLAKQGGTAFARGS